MSFRSDASFPERNLDDDRPMRSVGRSTPESWVCLECPASGAGFTSRNQHWRETGGYEDGGHHIVFGCDPRAKNAPKGAK